MLYCYFMITNYFCFNVQKKQNPVSLLLFLLLQKTSVLTRAGEQRRRCQSMKSYPSSELRNVCDEQVVVEPAEEGQDMLQQMLERRSVGRTLTFYLQNYYHPVLVEKNIYYENIEHWDKMNSYNSTLHAVYIATEIFKHCIFSTSEHL